jgi:sialate O-acetylesterase
MAVKDEPGERAWAELRDAQRQIAETVPNCGMAAAIDIGEADDIHPRNKRDVGRRLAWQALRKTYHLKDIHCDGPRLARAAVEGGAILLAFAAEGGALSTRDGAAPQGFAIAGADRKYHWAEAEIVDDRIVLRCPAVPQPRHVRYAWADNPVANLVDEAGLPATPFSVTVG